MARSCSICASGKSEIVDAAIFGSETPTQICKRLKLTPSQLRAHAKHALAPADFKIDKPASPSPSKTSTFSESESEPVKLESNSLDELIRQRQRLLEDIQQAKDTKNSYHQLKGEAALQKNIELHAKLEAEKNSLNIDAAIQTAAKAQINSLVRFLVHQLTDYPEAAAALQRALNQEYGYNPEYSV
ncbi:hypothetical protein ACFOOP_14200 [Marinicaulis aureus]|uniref:Uncharacterized protein n=1 Tax=Hyphococcus aureus TaxID=2666033 RepID=A0ABW1L032_9PROT